ncbi:MAG: hypothetical protein WC868_08795 [Bacteroidales bacterium]
MESVLVNIGSKKEVKFFLNLVKKMGYNSRVLELEDKEDSALLALMYERENEEALPIETTERILKNILKK